MAGRICADDQFRYTPDKLKKYLGQYDRIVACADTGWSPWDRLARPYSVDEARALLGDLDTAIARALRLNPSFAAALDLCRSGVPDGRNLSGAQERQINRMLRAMCGYLNRA